MSEFLEPSTGTLKRALILACKIIRAFARQAGINLETAELEMDVADAKVHLSIAAQLARWEELAK